MKRRTWRWVTRDPGGSSVHIWADEGKPKITEKLWVLAESCMASIPTDAFTAATGLKIRSDQPVKVDFGGCKIIK